MSQQFLLSLKMWDQGGFEVRIIKFGRLPDQKATKISFSILTFSPGLPSINLASVCDDIVPTIILKGGYR